MEVMDLGYWVRILISLLAACVAGLCFTKVIWTYASSVRNYRVAGLGLICAAVAWGNTARRNQEFKPWLVLILVGLTLCCYGMARFAPGELPEEGYKK